MSQQPSATVVDGLVAARDYIKRTKLRGFCRVFWPTIQPEKFLWNWHADAISEHLEAVTAGEIKRLIIVVPPGFMKSSLVSIFWPAWEWSMRPEEKYICVSYSDAVTFELASKNRDVVRSELYQQLYPGTRFEGKVDKMSLFKTTKNGFRLSTTPGGAATSFHCTRSMFDDISKAQDAQGRAMFDPVAMKKANDFWFKTMATRVADAKRHASVGVMQRLHKEDTAGKCIEAGYHALVLPVEYSAKAFSSGEKDLRCTSFVDPREEEGELLWPERMSREKLEEIKGSMSDRDYNAQFGCRPVPPGGNIFKEEWFRTWGRPDSIRHQAPNRSKMLILQSWDLTFKGKESSDNVCGLVIGVIDSDYLVLARYHGKMGFADTKKAMIQAYRDFPNTFVTYVEDKANGPAILEELAAVIPTLEAVDPLGGKEARANASQPTVASGHVYLPDAEKNPWVKEFLLEAKDFPYARNDDQVDALTQAITSSREVVASIAFHENL